MLLVGNKDASQHHGGGDDHRQRMADQPRQKARIHSRQPLYPAEIGVFAGAQMRHRVIGVFGPLAENAAQHRQEDHGRQQRGRQYDDHRGWQVGHELARYAGPEEHRQKGRQRRRRGGCDRPEHAFGGGDIGLARAQALGHLAVGVFDDDDGPVHQHADGQNKAEEHHVVHRLAGQPGEGEGDHEGCRNGHPDEQRRAHAKGRHADHHDQHDGRHDGVFQRADDRADAPRFIEGEVHVNGLRPVPGRRQHHFAHLPVGGQDIGPDALDHAQRDGRAAIEARVLRAVLEGGADGGHVGERHHLAVNALDGQGIDIARRLEQARHLDVEAPAAGVQRPRRDELVVALHRSDQFCLRDAVGIQLQFVDDDFQQFLALAGEIGLQHGGDGLYGVLQLLGVAVKRALRHVARQHHHDGGKEREVDLVDLRLLGVLGQIGLGQIDLLAHLLRRLVRVHLRLELHDDAGVVLRGDAGQLLQALQPAQLRLHRFDQQPLGVLRRDAGQGDGDVEHRHLNVGPRLLGDVDVGGDAEGQGGHKDGEHHPWPAQYLFQRARHERFSFSGVKGTGVTFCPGRT